MTFITLWPIKLNDTNHYSLLIRHLRISSNNEEIISKAIETAELLKLMNEGNPRLQYNMLRRHLMFRDGLMEFTTYLKTFRKIVLEIVMVPKVVRSLQSLKLMTWFDMRNLVYVEKNTNVLSSGSTYRWCFFCQKIQNNTKSTHDGDFGCFSNSLSRR